MYRIILSSCLYTVSFLYPTHLYPCIFIWMMPLIETKRHYSYKAGFIWGVISFGAHFIWLSYIIAIKGSGDARMILYFATVAYFSLYSAFWLWFQEQLYRYMNRFQSLKGKWTTLCCTWVISTVTFICLISCCSLAIFGCFEGYPFINPLLPLISWRWYVRGLPYLGCIGYWIVIVMVNVTLSKLYKEFDIKTLIATIALFGFPALFFQVPIKKAVNKNDFFYVQPTWNNQNLSASQIFYEIARNLDLIALKNSEISYIVMPESSFGYNLLDWQGKFGAWTSLYSDKTRIFIGAHRYENKSVFNSLYVIENGLIIDWYDKQHLVPFVERIPWWFARVTILCNLFTTPDLVFSYPNSTDQSAYFEGQFQPFICSELFCQSKKPLPDVPLLFICNDTWLGLNYAQELGMRSVQLYSLLHQVEIVCVCSEVMKIIN